MGLERGPLSLVSTINEVLEKNLKTLNTAVGDPRDYLCPQKFTLTSPTNGGRSLGRYSSLADSSHGAVFFVFF
jgi:hypothetical protein